MKITFDCPLWFYCPTEKSDKPLIESESGVHLIITDECDVQLNNENRQLSDTQQLALEMDESRINKRAKNKLLYLNTIVVQSIFEKEKEIRLRCPVCKREYILTKDAYYQAYEKFAKEGRKRV